MTTPFSLIYEQFDGKLTDNELTKFTSTNKRKSLLKLVYPKFKSYFRKLTIDYDTDSITEDLTEDEVLAWALYMFAEYCNQDWSKWNGIINTVTDSTKTTGVKDARDSKEKRYIKAEQDLSDFLATLI